MSDSPSSPSSLEAASAVCSGRGRFWYLGYCWEIGKGKKSPNIALLVEPLLVSFGCVAIGASAGTASFSARNASATSLHSSFKQLWTSETSSQWSVLNWFDDWLALACIKHEWQELAMSSMLIVFSHWRVTTFWNLLGFQIRRMRGQHHLSRCSRDWNVFIHNRFTARTVTSRLLHQAHLIAAPVIGSGSDMLVSRTFWSWTSCSAAVTSSRKEGTTSFISAFKAVTLSILPISYIHENYVGLLQLVMPKQC